MSVDIAPLGGDACVRAECARDLELRNEQLTMERRQVHVQERGQGHRGEHMALHGAHERQSVRTRRESYAARTLPTQALSRAVREVR